MTVVGDTLKRLTDVRRELRKCEHVKQGFHPYAKLLMRDYDLLVCVNCDAKTQMIEEWDKAALPRPK